jgi:hypothetical protein
VAGAPVDVSAIAARLTFDRPYVPADHALLLNAPQEAAPPGPTARRNAAPRAQTITAATARNSNRSGVAQPQVFGGQIRRGRGNVGSGEPTGPTAVMTPAAQV